jgi:hypothetical protein
MHPGTASLFLDNVHFKREMRGDIFSQFPTLAFECALLVSILKHFFLHSHLPNLAFCVKCYAIWAFSILALKGLPLIELLEPHIQSSCAFLSSALCSKIISLFSNRFLTPSTSLRGIKKKKISSTQHSLERRLPTAEYFM